MVSIFKQHKAFFLSFLPLFFCAGTLSALSAPFKFSFTILCILLFLVAFLKTDFALIVLIFSMLLSPELELGGAGARAITLRFDDIFIFIVFFGWLAKMAVNKELGLIRSTSLNMPIICYIAVCIIATILGIFADTVNLLSGVFFTLKYIEYFLLYFLFVNNIKSIDQLKRLIFAFFITGFIVCIYATFQIGMLDRVTAPFEGRPEPNTLGGYLIILFSIATGLFLYSRSSRWKFISGILACSVLPAFIFTLSRTGYVAFLASYFVFLSFAKGKRFILVMALLIVVIGSVIAVPRVTQTVAQRVKRTFGYKHGPKTTYEYGGKKITLEESAAARIESWKTVLNQIPKKPFFGYGVTGVGLVDSQYPRVIGETGLIGFFIFLWMLSRIFTGAHIAFLRTEDFWLKGFCLGFFAAFIGILVHSLGANTFIIVRIMEPFWFLAAVVMVLPRLEIEENQARV
jgi:O-antigen ligase